MKSPPLFTEDLLCARHHTACSSCIISLNPYKDQIRFMTFHSSFTSGDIDILTAIPLLVGILTYWGDGETVVRVERVKP